MSLRLKAIAAAVALVAVAAAPAANAAMATAGSGDSSLILTLIDNNANISATFDLGFNYSTFSSLVSQATSNGGSFTWDLTSGNYGSAWSTYWSTATLADSQWALYGADGTGSGVGSRGMIITKSGGTNLSLTTQLNASITNFDEYIGANNGINALGTAGATSNHDLVADGASTATGGAAFAEFGKAYGTTGKVNGTGFDTTQALNSSMSLLQILSGATTTSAVTTTTLGNALGSYSLSLSSNGALTFTVPVPEADSYAMIVAGLGLVGFASRRRNAK